MRFVDHVLATNRNARAPADLARGRGPDLPVMELVTFQLTAGITEAEFLAAAKSTEALVAAQPGFTRRSLLRDEAGEWTDAVAWQSLDAAQKAATVVLANPDFAAFAAAIDMQSVSMRHIPILWQMGG